MIDDRSSNRPFAEGAILIYVLWILVVISVLAFQLTSASRVITLNRSAVVNQLKIRMQLDSAIQFAIFQIQSNKWENKGFELNLNDQVILINIFNESGFISIYKMSSKSLKKILDITSIDKATIEDMQVEIFKNDLRFNSFAELRQFSDVNRQIIEQLIPLISIFHEGAVNPRYSPEDVLMLLPGIDQYRVQKLRETRDEADRNLIKGEIVELLTGQGFDTSEGLNAYFRVHVSLGNRLYRVFLKYIFKQKKYQTVLVVRQNSENSDFLDR